MSSANFKIEGITCQSCVTNIQKLLAQTPGISEVSINLPNKTIALNFDDGVINLNQIAKIIEDAGFDPIL